MTGSADRREPMRLLDTLTGELRPLDPIEAGRVGIYSCGPTVYGPAHIGNFRSFLFADLLVRHLRWRGLDVTWVMNITDVDDKIIRGAAASVSVKASTGNLEGSEGAGRSISALAVATIEPSA